MAKKKANEKSDQQYNPFLKATDIKDGDVFDLSGWAREVNGRFGAQIIVEGVLRRTGKTYDLGINKGNPNHRILHTRMGPDPFKWSGAITLGLGKGRNGPFVVVREHADDIPF